MLNAYCNKCNPFIESLLWSKRWNVADNKIAIEIELYGIELLLQQRSNKSVSAQNSFVDSKHQMYDGRIVFALCPIKFVIHFVTHI